MKTMAIIGAQWGDEGKGKITDLLAEKSDLVVRYQGGHNAGHTIWVNGQKTVLRATLVEEFFFTVESKGNYFTVLDKIEEKREYYSGNYDGMLGKVSNFNWSFNVDGSYDIELTIISLGDVIESIKTNLSVDKGTLEFLQETGKLTPTEIENEAPSEPDVLEDNKSANIISSMLYVWKFINNTPEPRGNKNFINPADGGEFGLASFLVPTQEGEVSSTITSDQVKYQFVATYISKQETEAAEKSDKQASEKLALEREKLQVARENQANDLAVAKENAKGRSTTKKPKK
jgi:hypothetical protein